jgi:hypothetical protein
MLSVSRGGETLSWGSQLDVDTAQPRETYIKALQAADDGEMNKLMAFAVS